MGPNCTVGLYNEAIHLSDEASDAATRELLESIVKEEDDHVDWLEEQLDQVAQLGVPLYLSTQTRTSSSARFTLTRRAGLGL